jgi:hypothetical protein
MNTLEENYKADLRNKEKAMQETADDIRNNSSKELSRERENSRSEIDRLKRETYDRNGRYNGLEAQEANQQLRETQKALQEEQSQHQKALRAQDDNYDHRLEEIQADNTDRQEKLAQSSRDSALEAYERMAKNQSKYYDDVQDAARKRYQEITESMMSDNRAQRQNATHAIGQAKQDFDHRTHSLEQSYQNRIDDMNYEHQRDLTHAEAASLASHKLETDALRAEVKDLLSTNKGSEGLGDQTANAIRNIENESRRKQQLVVDNYDREIADLKDQAKRTENGIARTANEAIREKDAFYADVLGKHAEEEHKNQKIFEDSFNQYRDQADYLRQKQRDQTNARFEQVSQDAADHLANVLLEHANTSNANLNKQRKDDLTQINTLERELQYRKTSADASSASPAAEETIRGLAEKEFNKRLDAERTRNASQTDTLQTNLNRRYLDTVAERDARETTMVKQNMADMQGQRREFINHISDVEFLRDAALHTQQQAHDRENEKMTHDFSTTLERQRRQYEEILQTLKSETQDKIEAMRQESDFNMKMAQRTFSMRENELIRDYEKKLSDQKTDYDKLIDDIKAQAEHELRESERKNRIATEELTKNYDRRLAQSELQQKEHERNLTKSYEDEMDKIRRANALLIQKKS